MNSSLLLQICGKNLSRTKAQFYFQSVTFLFTRHLADEVSLAERLFSANSAGENRETSTDGRSLYILKCIKAARNSINHTTSVAIRYK